MDLVWQRTFETAVLDSDYETLEWTLQTCADINCLFQPIVASSNLPLPNAQGCHPMAASKMEHAISPLMFACFCGKHESVERLLRAGAKAAQSTLVHFRDLQPECMLAALPDAACMCTPLAAVLYSAAAAETDEASRKDSLQKLKTLNEHGARATHFAVCVAIDLCELDPSFGPERLKVVVDEFDYDTRTLMSRLCHARKRPAIVWMLTSMSEQVFRFVDSFSTAQEAFFLLGVLTSPPIRRVYAYALGRRCGRVNDVVKTALCENDLGTVRSAIEQGYDLNSLVNGQMTVLAHMCLEKRYECVKHLLELKSDPNVRLECQLVTNMYPTCALHTAIMSLPAQGGTRSIDAAQDNVTATIVDLLILHGADPHTGIGCAFEYKRLQTLHLLLTKHWHLFERGRRYAEVTVNLDCLFQLLKQYSSAELAESTVDAMLEDHQYALLRGDPVSITTQNYKEWIGFMRPADRALMLSVCCSMHDPSPPGDRYTQIIMKTNPHLEDVLLSHRDELINALLDGGLHPSPLMPTHVINNTALCLSVYNENLKIVDLLLKRRADVNMHSQVDYLKNYDTPALIACMRESPVLLDRLVQHGLDVKAHLSRRNYTALTHVLLVHETDDIEWRAIAASMLLKHGACPVTPLISTRLRTRQQWNTVVAVYDRLEASGWLHDLCKTTVRAVFAKAHPARMSCPTSDGFDCKEAMAVEAACRKRVHKCVRAAIKSVLSSAQREDMVREREEAQAKRSAKDLAKTALQWSRLVDAHTIALRERVKLLKMAKRALDDRRSREQEEKAEVERKRSIAQRKEWEGRLAKLRAQNAERERTTRAAVEARKARAQRQETAHRQPPPPRVRTCAPTAARMNRLCAECVASDDSSNNNNNDDDDDDVCSVSGLSAVSLAVSVATVDVRLPVASGHYGERINERFEEEVLHNDIDVTYEQQHTLKHGSRHETHDGKVLHKGRNGFTMITNRTSSRGVTAYRTPAGMAAMGRTLPRSQIRCMYDGECRIVNCEFKHVLSWH